MTYRPVPFLVGVALVDIPVLALVAIVGHDHPVQTVTSFVEWRADHPWTFLLAIPAVMFTVTRIRRRTRP